MKKVIMYALMLIMNFGLAYQSKAVTLEKRSNETRTVSEMKTKKENPVKAGDAKTIDKTLYIVLSILGLGWLAVGLNEDWQGNNWLIALGIGLGGVFVFGLLGLFFFPFFFLMFVPGLIYALMKMKNYYN